MNSSAPPLTHLSTSADRPPEAWIRTGIAFYVQHATLSAAATPITSPSDWSLVPLSLNWVTTVVGREQEGKGNHPSLGVYPIDYDKRKAVREITWAFVEERLDEELYVGLYVARPTKLLGNENDIETLFIVFRDFKLDITRT